MLPNWCDPRQWTCSPPGDPDNFGAATTATMCQQPQPMTAQRPQKRHSSSPNGWCCSDLRNDVPAAPNNYDIQQPQKRYSTTVLYTDDVQRRHKRCSSSPQRSVMMRQFQRMFSPGDFQNSTLYTDHERHFGDPTLLCGGSRLRRGLGERPRTCAHSIRPRKVSACLL